MEDEINSTNLQIIATPQIKQRTKDIPAPGCDSSTPKPDKVRSSLTPIPDESPIQPTVHSDKETTAASKQKHNQCMSRIHC